MKKKNPLQIREAIAVEKRGGWWGNIAWYSRVSHDNELYIKRKEYPHGGFRICRTTRNDQ